MVLRASKRYLHRCAVVGLLFASLGSAWAAPIELLPGSLFMFRDNRGLNDVGSTPGDRLQYGANIRGGSLGTSLSAHYAPQGLTDPTLVCAPLLTNRNFCNNSVTFANTNPASPFFGIARIEEGGWTFTFTRAGEAPLVVPAPTLHPAGTDRGIDFLVPHPRSVTIGGSPLAPTISWSLPTGYVPDGFRVQIQDLNRRTATGGADIIHSVQLTNPATTSYAVPGVLSTGLALEFGGKYSINFEIAETRGSVPFVRQADLISRSQSWFSFSPLPVGGIPEAFLPSVGPDPIPGDLIGAPFVFHVEGVGPSHVTFVDPFVAVGYDYAIGAGDPNFASVLFPDVGDGVFELLFGSETHEVAHGVQFFFPAGGVGAFSVRGIEVGAGLDPEDGTAFVTGLTFVAAGDFTGTMTPILQEVTASVPVPATLLLLGAGLAALGIARSARFARTPVRG